jgi:hypothetical protein
MVQPSEVDNQEVEEGRRGVIAKLGSDVFDDYMDTNTLKWLCNGGIIYYHSDNIVTIDGYDFVKVVDVIAFET